MSAAANLTVWPLDGLSRLFVRDAAPRDAERRREAGWDLACAGGEYITFQLAVRPQWRVSDISVVPTALRCGRATIAAEDIQSRFVDLVPMPLGKWCPPERPDEIPGWYPDPLMDENPWARMRSMNMGPSLSMHFTLRVRHGTPPGIYRGSVAVLREGKVRARVPVKLEVWPFSIPRRPSFHVTNWFHLDCITKWHRCEPWSERHWRILDLYAREMAAHRQDVISTPVLFGNFHNEDPMTLVDITRTRAGGYRFDFRRLERWVALFDRHGFRLFEMWHMASQGQGKHAPRFRVYDEKAGARREYGELSVNSTAYRKLVRAFLSEFTEWLDRRNLTKRFLMHVFDEPQPNVWPHYARLSAFLRECAPGLKHLDAISTSELMTKFGAHVDIPVPCTPHLDDDEYYRRRAREGRDPVWWYTCCGPCDDVHTNRFVCMPLISTRMLQWQAFAMGISGYLHWGYNFWHRVGQDASRWPGINGYADQTLVNPYREHWFDWPVGDAAIVYPDPHWWEDRGPVSSLRYEAMREGLCDYELLRLLEKASAQSGAGPRQKAAVTESRRILKAVRTRLAPTTGWCRDPQVLLRTRRRMGACISALA